MEARWRMTKPFEFFKPSDCVHRYIDGIGHYDMLTRDEANRLLNEKGGLVVRREIPGLMSDWTLGFKKNEHDTHEALVICRRPIEPENVTDAEMISEARKNKLSHTPLTLFLATRLELSNKKLAVAVEALQDVILINRNCHNKNLWPIEMVECASDALTKIKEMENK